MQDRISILYVRRRDDDSLDRIINLAEQQYAAGIADFLIVDMSGDTAALSVLGRRGDPVRYLANASASPLSPLLQGGSGVMHGSRVVVIDDRPLDGPTEGLMAVPVEFMARDDFVASTTQLA